MQDECGTLGVKGHGILSPQIDDQPQASTPLFAALRYLRSLMPRQGFLKAAPRNSHRAKLVKM
jgi:hypothetical protein